MTHAAHQDVLAGQTKRANRGIKNCMTAVTKNVRAIPWGLKRNTILPIITMKKTII